MSTTRALQVTEATPALLAELVRLELRRLVAANGETTLTDERSAVLLVAAVNVVADTVSAGQGVERGSVVLAALQGLRG